MFNDYILRNNLPDQKSVSTFTEQLYQYLFPIVKNEATFLADRKTLENRLRKVLLGFIDTCSEGSDIAKASVCDKFFDDLSNTADELIKDAKFILDYDPAANR